MSTVTGAFLSFCNGYRDLLERDYNPREVGDKHNTIEGIGSQLYLPSIYSLNSVIRLLNIHACDRTAGEAIFRVAAQAGAVAMVVLTAPLAAVGSIAKWAGSIVPHAKVIRTESVFSLTEPEKIDQIYDIVESFSEAAKEIGIDYRMVAGTALGAARHGGIIPWDDDADFGVLETEREKIEIAIRDGVFKKWGIEATFFPLTASYHIHLTGDERARRNYTDQGDIDLFLLKFVDPIETSSARIVYAAEFSLNVWPHEYFTKEEWDQTAEWKFGPGLKKICLKGVTRNVTERYLKRAYGNDCLTCGLKTHKHTEITLFGRNFSALAVFTITREKVRIANPVPATGVRWQ